MSSFQRARVLILVSSWSMVCFAEEGSGQANKNTPVVESSEIENKTVSSPESDKGDEEITTSSKEESPPIENSSIEPDAVAPETESRVAEEQADADVGEPTGPSIVAGDEPLIVSREYPRPAPVVLEAAKVPEKPNYSRLPWTYHLRRVDVSLGLTARWLPDSSVEIFAPKKVVPSLRARLAYPVFVRDHMSLSVLGAFTTLGASGKIRGAPTQMRLHQFLAGGEGRYLFTHFLDIHSRLSAGLASLNNRLGQEDAAAVLEMSRYLFSGDISLGTSLRVLGDGDGRLRRPRLHITIDGGYSYVARTQQSYEVGDDGPLRPEPVELGRFSASGPFFGVGITGSY